MVGRDEDDGSVGGSEVSGAASWETLIDDETIAVPNSNEVFIHLILLLLLLKLWNLLHTLSTKTRKITSRMLTCCLMLLVHTMYSFDGFYSLFLTLVIFVTLPSDLPVTNLKI